MKSAVERAHDRWSAEAERTVVVFAGPAVLGRDVRDVTPIAVLADRYVDSYKSELDRAFTVTEVDDEPEWTALVSARTGADTVDDFKGLIGFDTHERGATLIVMIRPVTVVAVT